MSRTYRKYGFRAATLYVDQTLLKQLATDSFQDIGGGWPLDAGDDAALSHVPLVWMVREAQKAGLDFDDEKLLALNCYPEDLNPPNLPTISVNTPTPSSGATLNVVDCDNFASHHATAADTEFARIHHFAATRGRIHDVLQFNNGAGHVGVASWNAMEYMPFRRMDLQENGTWKAIRWPLPKGETRDIPPNAIIHSSVIKRMLADDTYRPGNLIVGGGGRGVRHAPQDMGIGKWVCVKEEGHPVGECFARKDPPVRAKTDDGATMTAMPGGPQGNYFGGR